MKEGVLAIYRAEKVHPSPDEHRSNRVLIPVALAQRRLLRMPRHGCIWFLCQGSMGECQVCCHVSADSACSKHRLEVVQSVD